MYGHIRILDDIRDRFIDKGLAQEHVLVLRGVVGFELLDDHERYCRIVGVSAFSDVY